MRSQSSELIILRQRNFKENDKIISVYSKNFGKLYLKVKSARNIKSKFIGLTQNLNILNAEIYFGPHTTLLTEAKIKHSPSLTDKSIEKILYLLKLAEITDKLLFEEQKIEGLYPLLKECLNTIETQDKESLSIKAYSYKLLDLLGLSPDFKELSNNIQEKYVKFFKFLKHYPLKALSKIKLTKNEEKEITLILERLLKFQTDKEIKLEIELNPNLHL